MFDFLKRLISNQRRGWACYIPLSQSLFAIKEGECYSKNSDKLYASGTACKADFKSKVDGKDVEFTDKSQPSDGGLLVTGYWEFGDATTSSLQNSSHTYFNAGSYEVKFKKDKADIIKASIGGDIFYEDCETAFSISRTNSKTNDKCIAVNMNVWFDNSKI